MIKNLKVLSIATIPTLNLSTSDIALDGKDVSLQEMHIINGVIKREIKFYLQI
ncbi:hypothetical protein [Campylobacter gracilis]|uniref:Uncharacterized protein n=1 Tax=Campylobacter gracilis RM3268 TaxID=553220 RepID=C8PGY6_9BACT|nr:hypothetical protein [Campylobacter gracilis]EEV17807.1 hypothetical protein CAMGR0001_2174 [Campylobacter gracilis RM3268]UEB46512.1 hypothetical protein LK410_05345 [Campylobacter gracilis]SUW78288.1 Uncharacterised protein [Campylobacter gracilis]